jgi:tetratricopeptide (TPR) repeat protein
VATIDALFSSFFLRQARTAALLFGILLPHFLSSAALAQTGQDLRRLIFEPAWLPVATADSGPATPAGTDAAAATQAASAARSADVDPADELRALEADIASYEAGISTTLGTESPFSTALREQYYAMGSLLQQTGAHEEAIAAFESAMHIDRVNGGLFTLDQIPLVEEIIESHASLGNFREVSDYHEYLFYIQQKTFAPEDPRLLAAKEDWADWNVEAYLKEGMTEQTSPYSFNASASMAKRNDYVAIQNPRNGTFNYVPREQLPNVLNPNGAATNAAVTDYYLSSSFYAISPEMIIDERLRTARGLYEDIIETRTELGVVTTDFDVEHKLANIAYAVKEQMDMIEAVTDIGSLNYNRVMQPRTTSQVVSRGYSKSRDTLEQIAQDLAQRTDVTQVQKAMAYINLGDWHVSFDRAQRGEDAYAKAWELLNESGMDETAIAGVFMPRPLIPVPEFAIHDYSRTLYGIAPDAVLEYKGHIDLTLSVDRYGSVRGLNIDEVSPGTPQILRNNLLDFLRDRKMRPAVANGETVARTGLKLRYYYTY